jgi:hypothetical protein
MLNVMDIVRRRSCCASDGHLQLFCRTQRPARSAGGGVIDL